MSIWEQTQIKPIELDNPPPSIVVGYLLDYFFELSQARQMGMAVNPLSYADIDAWCRLTHTRLSQWELNVIKQLDLIWLTENNE